MMTVRAVNTCYLLCTGPPPPLSSFRCRFNPFRDSDFSRGCGLQLRLRFPVLRCELVNFGHGGFRSCLFHSLLESAMEELSSYGRRRKGPAAVVKLTSTGELLDYKPGSITLAEGLLLEFKKDSDRLLLALAQKPDGRQEELDGVRSEWSYLFD
ncbi:unnamed protein product [Linum trigynum]|uniref:Ribonuclease II-like barrel domain-containing protein n=1 Tax=Linum trigynum TaxID=586398 RepID=A0AAV2DZZ1_9ROSI